MPVTALLSGAEVGLLCLALLFGAALAGMLLVTAQQPGGPLRAAAGLIGRGTMLLAIPAALVLSFMVVSLKSSFDAADHDVRRFADELNVLNRALRRAGPVADPIRETLFRYTTSVMKDLWPDSHPNLRGETVSAPRLRERLEQEVDGLRTTAPTVAERARLALRDAQLTRIDLDSHYGRTVSVWLLGVLLFWLCLTFAGLGTAAPRTPLAITALFLLAAAISGGIFLACEYDDPFTGVITVSAEPLENVLFLMTE